MLKVSQLVRNNILNLKPYSCARNEFKGNASVFLDANENPMNFPYNRYPDPMQTKLKKKIAGIKKVRPSQIMLGVGSDDPIDLIIRIFCKPKEDNIVAIDPSYGMYQVCADINNVEYRKVLLNDDFSLDAERILNQSDNKTKVLLAEELKNLPFVEKIFPSDANFLPVKVKDAIFTYNYLVDNGIIVRKRNNISLCLGCLRITIGMEDKNKTLINVLKLIK